MRNDSKILALRRKYGMEGYGIYNMLIEVLTDAEGFRWEKTELSLEIMAGDFGIKQERLSEIMAYLIKLDLIQVNDNSEITCKTLEKQLEPLLSKREYDRNRVSGSYRNENDEESIVEYSREKESKVEKSKGEEISLSDFETLLNKQEEWIEEMHIIHKGKDIAQTIKAAYAHLKNKKRLGRGELSDFKGCVQSFLNNEKPGTGGVNGKSKAEQVAEENKRKIYGQS